MKPGDPLPTVQGVDEDGNVWIANEQPEGWMCLGIAPRPDTTLRCFLYHLGHGLVMQYPLLSVLWFSWRNRHNYREAPPTEGDRAVIEYIFD